MRGVMLFSGLLLAVGCAKMGMLGPTTDGRVALASDCGVSVKPPDPAKIPVVHPVSVGAASYLIDPAEVPASMIVQIDEQQCDGAGPNSTKIKVTKPSIRVVKLRLEATPERAPAAVVTKNRYGIDRELMPSEW